jgi:gamma-glutamylcyclotransferase (GGCT)/AIG2-like uncharacterized protein YtfP
MKNTLKAKSKRFYFAYGSNCNLRQMAQRCPRASVVGAVTLNNYALGFNGKMSGWGVANIRRRNGGTVHGLLWEITPECERSLDQYEGYPYLYKKRNVTVYSSEAGTAYKAMVYVMTEAYREPALPSEAYYDGIWAGFRQNRISTDTLAAALKQTCSQVSKLTFGGQR